MEGAGRGRAVSAHPGYWPWPAASATWRNSVRRTWRVDPTFVSTSVTLAYSSRSSGRHLEAREGPGGVRRV